MGLTHLEICQHLHGFLLALTPPQHGCGQVGGQAGQLVPHQGDEGGDHQAGPPQYQCWQLVA